MSEAPVFCANHPNRETSLRCNRCGKPICSSCAILTPVGYRCKECVRNQQAGFDTAKWIDYPIALVTTGVGVGIAITFLNYLSFWGFLVAPVVGGGLAEVIHRLIGRRRSRSIPKAIIIGGTLGVLPHIIPILVTLVQSLRGGTDPGLLASMALSAILPVAYGFLMITTLYYRFRGIRV
jgi:hypothetical protein